ncbi:DUF4834 family protein [Kordia sp. YSTF-M3]|jgi:hypothetical protein|uniref:DUF4834 family protein n=1 Tax=Kordia aestuariivivens TaxID=2759037 RepID=A0ABR7QFR0_9FLAO|nr:DUF4834 family protein [Kordia aestuariivivens]MBC8757410.1 DUF4834 family protein [Kordia aestuariivivens]
MGVLRTIAIIILVIYGLRILARLFAPVMIRYVAKKAEKKFSEQFKQHAENQQRTKEGETSIDKMPDTKSSKNVGEYIDFEEVD